MEINLLPRPSFYQKNRFAIVFLSALVVLSGGGYAALVYNDLNQRVERTQAELDRTKSDISVLIAERIVSPETRRFNELKQAVTPIQKQEHDYGVMMDGIAAKLTPKMRVTSAIFQAEVQSVVLTVDTESIEAIADYEELLRTEPWVRDVFVRKIENEAHALNDTDQKSDQKNDQKTDQSINEKDRKERPYSTEITILLEPKEVPVEKRNSP